MISLPQWSPSSHNYENYPRRGRFELESGDRLKGVKHHRIVCDGCEKSPILGARYRCLQCDNFDFCSTCFDNQEIDHPESHTFALISKAETCPRCDCPPRWRQFYVPGGNDPRVYDVERLWSLTSTLPVEKLPISHIKIPPKCTRASCRSCDNPVDLDFPILVREIDGEIIDGAHRARAALKGKVKEVKVRLVSATIMSKASVTTL